MNLEHTDVTDDGLCHLEALAELRVLNLDNTYVTNRGVRLLGRFQRLELLNVYHTLITEEGHERLKAVLPECEIIWDPESRLPNRRRA